MVTMENRHGGLKNECKILINLSLFVVSLNTTNAGKCRIARVRLDDDWRQSLTRDTVSGFDWLELTLSTNRSYLDINGQFGSGSDFEGFRYASTGEVATLWENAGIVFSDRAPTGGRTDGSPENAVAAGMLIALIGETNPQEGMTKGMTGTYLPGLNHSSLGYLFNGGYGKVGWTNTSPTPSWPVGDPNRTIGSWLVRVTSVPEPSSISLMLLGFALVSFMCEQKPS